MFYLVERINLLEKIRWREVMQPVGRVGIAKHNHKWPVEELGAVYFYLVGIRVSRELRAVSFEIQDVEA